MTEAEWVTTIEPSPMLTFLKEKITIRKMRLLPCARFRATKSGRVTAEEMHAIDVAELLADGKVRGDDHLSPVDAFRIIFLDMVSGLGSEEERRLLSAILRDIFGNPFRPVTINPSWLTSTVFTLAQQIYDSRDFSAMPILADALQDAGCDNEDILDHCRQPGEHVRGCWLVDLLIGRT
jgi:hypothetical protein